MRTLLFVVWMLIPVGALAYHLGPGQGDLKSDRAAQLLAEADTLVAEEQWPKAIENYKEALDLLPEDDLATRRKTRLELAKCEIHNSGLPQANEDLKALVQELMEDPLSDPQTLTAARVALANSQFYITWLMRLEGRPQETWEPEITSSQQIYRLLAEQSEASLNMEAVLSRKSDLESSVKLARMDIGELQGLPLPSQ